MMQAPRRLWLTADRGRLVEDGDPEAAFLFSAGPGDSVLAADAQRYGLAEAEPRPAPAEAAPVETGKTPEPRVEDKAVTGPRGPERVERSGGGRR